MGKLARSKPKVFGHLVIKFSKVFKNIELFVIFFYISIKVNESRYKQSGVTPHFSTWQNILKKTEER